MLDNSISTALAGLLANYFGMDGMKSLYLSTVIQWLSNWLTSVELEFSNYWFLTVIPFVLYGVKLFYQPIYDWYQLYYYNVLTIYDKEGLLCINRYLLNHPNSLPDDVHTTIGSYQKLEDRLQIPQKLTIVKVHNFNCKMCLIIRNRRRNYQNRDPVTGHTSPIVVDEHIPELVVYLPKHIRSCDFLSKIDELNEEHEEKYTKDNIQLIGYRIMYAGETEKIRINDKNLCSQFFYQVSRSEHDPEQLIKRWYHPRRDILIASIKQAIMRKDNWGGILHGPPGTGKSSFSTLLAKVFERHIFSVDLRLLNRPQTFNMFGRDYSKKYIFVLEEFDYVVKFLIEREERIKRFEENANATGVTKNCPIDDSKRLKLSDLLEILQGPIPHPELIVVATTNDLSYIKNVLPSLIRPGRLTPVHIGYLDQETFNQIVADYFPGQPELILPTEHKISTSCILEYAKTFNYDQFVKLVEAEF